MPLHSGAYVSIHVPDETEAWHNLSSGTAAGFGLEAAMHSLRRVISHHSTLTAPALHSIPSTIASTVGPLNPVHTAAASSHHHPACTSSPQTTLPRNQAQSTRSLKCHATSSHTHSSTPSLSVSKSPSLTNQSSAPTTAAATSSRVASLPSSNSAPSPCPALRKPLLAGLTMSGVCRGSAANLIVGAAWSGIFGSVYVPVSQSVEATLARANRRRHKEHLLASEANHQAVKASMLPAASLPAVCTSTDNLQTNVSHSSHSEQIVGGISRECGNMHVSSSSSSSSSSYTSTDDSQHGSSNSSYSSSSSNSTAGSLGSRDASELGLHASTSSSSSISDSSNLWLVPACAAGAASLCSSVVRFPLEQVTAWQGKKGGNISSALEYQALVRAHGMTGLYRGWWRSVICGVPLDAALFTIYDSLKQWGVARAGGGRELYSYETAVAGGVSGAIAALLTFPLDLMFGEKSTSSTPCVISSKSKILRNQSCSISALGNRNMSSSASLSQHPLPQHPVAEHPVTQHTARSLHAAYTAGSPHAAGLRAMFLKSAHKAGWTAFASAVFFPCLEAGIVAFDVHLHETDLGQDDDEENGHDHGPRSGLPTAGMHVYH